ncbi:unannotated protein [freshwater metagenome]|uniref:Unannotated protein n=1 Tax=freshwater metagenome TaxID=449393 RepID=A0A6J7JBT0_9ZZZZ
MTGIHRLQHVERFSAANFAYDNAVGSHSKRVTHKITNRDLANALNIRWAGFQSDHVRKIKRKLNRVFHRDDAVVTINERRQDIEKRGLTSTSATTHENVETLLDCQLQQICSLRAQGAQLRQTRDGQIIRCEFANCHRRTIDGKRRKYRVQSRTVWKSRIDHWTRLVNTSTCESNHPIDHGDELVVGIKSPRQSTHHTMRFHVDVVGAIHHDF